MKKYFSVILSILTAVTVGCGSSNDFNHISGQQGNPGFTPRPTPTVSPTPLPEVANLRIVNTSVDLGNFSVKVDGAVVDADLDALEATKYLELEPGTHTVTITGAENHVDTTTVTLAADSYSSTVYAPATGILSQTTGDMDKLVTLTDDVTPVAGKLNARLFNAFTIDSSASLYDDNFDDTGSLLLGPVDEVTATAYKTFAAATGASEYFIATVDVQGNTLTGFFDKELGGSNSFVKALVDEVGVSGANLSIFVTISPTGQNRLYLFALVDEAGDGSRGVRSATTPRG